MGEQFDFADNSTIIAFIDTNCYRTMARSIINNALHNKLALRNKPKLITQLTCDSSVRNLLFLNTSDDIILHTDVQMATNYEPINLQGAQDRLEHFKYEVHTGKGPNNVPEHMDQPYTH